MNDLAPLIIDLAIMLSIASIVILVFQKIRQPVVLGYIIVGMIVGPHTTSWPLIKDTPQLHTLSELGIIFLMFALGLDFSFHKIKDIGFSALITGMLKVVITGFLGFFIGRCMDWSVIDSIFLGAAVAISSTTIIIKVLDELNLSGKRFTDIVFGILIVEDLIAILMLTTLSTVGLTKEIISMDMLWSVAKLILVVGSWFLSGYFLVPILFRKVIKTISQETLTITSIALCLGLAAVASYFHYSDALGAFIMGSILAETPIASRIKKLTLPLRDMFAAVFFISIGMLIDPKVILLHWPVILLIAALAICCKIVVTTLGTFLTGQSVNNSVRTGFSMAPIGEFSFILASLGLTLKLTTNSLYQTIIGVATVSILAAPYLIKLSNVITSHLNTKLSDRAKYFLDSYTAWVYRALASYKKQSGYRHFVQRMIINSIVVTIIFTLVYDFMLPELPHIIHNRSISKIICWVIALFGASPFIWGMLFSFKLVHKSRQIPPLFLAVILTIVQIIVLSAAYFSTWHILVVVALVATIFFGLSARQLGLSYKWFERRLVRFLHSQQHKQTKYEELAPWDTHLAEIIATNEALDSMVGKTLTESQLRQKFGINIVTIYRGSKVIFAPRGEEKILPYDKLIILGNDEQIEAFKQLAETTHHDNNEDMLKNFTMRPLLLEDNNPLIGQSIRNSHLREQISGLVVGLERHGFRMLNPDPAIVLQANDLLLVVGKEDALIRLLNTKRR